VPIYRGREATGFAQDDTGVDVQLSDGQSLRAEYLVACEGGRRLVRKAAGIEFSGWDPTISGLIAYSWTGSHGQRQLRGALIAAVLTPRARSGVGCFHYGQLHLGRQRTTRTCWRRDIRYFHRAIPSLLAVKRKENQTQNLVKVRYQNWLEFCKRDFRSFGIMRLFSEKRTERE
jgi:2-polyprenyl-6-methoxyphenol hydroxylase-like FAD-dependent oxidoreductase